MATRGGAAAVVGYGGVTATADACQTEGLGVGWHGRAACVRADPELFVGDRRGEPEAFMFCRQCPVLAHCDEFANSNGERYGVWGGSLRG